jgi:outer membrane protein
MEEINRATDEIQLHTARWQWLPSADVRAGPSFGFGRFEDKSGDVATLINQKTFSTSFSVNSSMPLFTGFQITNDIKSKRYSVLAAEEALKRAKENIAVAVAQAFLDVLLRKEILKINEETYRFTNESVKRTEVMVVQGSMPLAQLYEIKSQQASDEAHITSADNDVKLGLLTLSQLLELASTDGFEVDMPQLDSAALAALVIPTSNNIYATALAVKPQIREAELQFEQSKAQLGVAKAGYYPQLSLSAGVSDNYYRMLGNDVPIDGFGAQLDKNLSEYVGLSLQIPIFSRFSTQNSVRSAQLNINNRQLALENVRKTLYKEIQQAYHNATAAQKNYNAARKSVEAAREAFRYAESKYQTGKSSVYEFTEAKTTLSRAMAEEAQAKFNYLFAVKILDFYAGKPLTITNI